MNSHNTRDNRVEELIARLTDGLTVFKERYQLFCEGQHLGLAVSGGLDSMMMLELFDRCKERLRLSLTVLHFNHRLRGRESDDDEAFVRRTCESKGLPFFADSGDAAAYAARQKLSVETAARELRYRFFESAAAAFSLDAVATAHTADDQAETVLDHFLRGCGIKGLSGIPLKRGRIIRPLLFVERRRLAEAAEAIGLPFREDSSNRSLAFRRNRIRIELLPLLRERFNPQIVAAVNRLAYAASELDAVQDQAAEELLRGCLLEKHQDKIVLDNQRILAYLNSLQRLILQHALKALREDPRRLSFSAWKNLSLFLTRQKVGGSFRLGRELRIIRESNRLTLERVKARPQPIFVDELGGIIPLWDDLLLEISPTEKPLTFSHPATIEYVDAETLRPPFTIRTFRAGDRLRPINSAGHKKVSDLMNEARVPLSDRQRIPILADQVGIVWVCGVRLDDRVKITETTRNILKLTLLYDRKVNL